MVKTKGLNSKNGTLRSIMHQKDYEMLPNYYFSIGHRFRFVEEKFKC